MNRCGIDWAAGNGHLETLKWLSARGIEYTDIAVTFSALRGHLDTLTWLKVNKAPVTTYPPRKLSRSNLEYCQRLGIQWGNMEQVETELRSLSGIECTDDLKCIIAGYITIGSP